MFPPNAESCVLKEIDTLLLQHVFKLEQDEYTREGIDWKEIKFVDNQPLLVSIPLIKIINKFIHL